MTGAAVGERYIRNVLGFRPEHDLARISRTVTDVAMYRDYDLTEEASSPIPWRRCGRPRTPGRP